MATATGGAMLGVAGCEPPVPGMRVVKDPLSNLEHPAALEAGSLLAPQESLALVGCGTRAVTFLNYYVYSVALYLREEDRRQWGNRYAEPLPEAFREAVNQSPRVIRLTPYRKAAFSHLRDGFNRALFARLHKSSVGPEEDERIRGELQELSQKFPAGNFQLGDELCFRIDGSRVQIFNNGRYVSEIDSAFVALELTLQYVDTDSVSPAARSSILEGLRQA